jgi:uncharacterized protein YjbJ (UPF0337 family)
MKIPASPRNCSAGALFTSWHSHCGRKSRPAPGDAAGKQNHSGGKDMNTLELKGNWNIAKGKLKQKFAQLTDDDLQYVEGKEEELMGRIQKRTGQTREQLEEAMKEECSSCSTH